MLRPLAALIIPVLVLTGIPATAEAQYFGRNKVQYEQFDFQVLRTPHYDIHFYPEAADAIEDIARMAERWYERIARVFEHDIRDRRPLVMYAAHPHFQQTNILRGSVGEGTGGVTEGLRDRIVMPIGDSYGSTDHVLGHEIVHSFQFDIAQSRQGAGLQGIMSLPLWFVEGMAEYFSLGGESSLTAMWLRDAVLRDEFPTLQQMSRDFRYFPYRFGHAFWAWVGGTYGDRAVGEMFRVAVRTNWQVATSQVLRISPDTLNARWKRSVTEHYAPLLEDRTPPGEAGSLLLAPSTGAGTMNVAPALSPDGRYLVFLSERDLFTIELFLADARTGEILRTLTRSDRDAHFDAIRFIDSSGAWSPDGQNVAVSVFADGRNRIHLYDVETGRITRRVTVPREIGEIRSPTFSPDGTRIAFSGQAEGVTDLYMVELESGEVTRLTSDRYTVLQPTFSPDGNNIAFVTDRGPATDFRRLTFGPKAIGIYHIDSGTVERLAPLGDADHWNPQYAPDGRALYLLADPDGFRDIYRVGLGDGQVWRVTRLATGVSGITDAAPALTVAREAGSAAFSVFDGSEFHVFGLDAVGAAGDPVQAQDVLAMEGRRLPGAAGASQDRVARLLEDPEVGLPPEGAFRAGDANAFRSRLGLDFVGQPTIGVGQDQFGTFLGGSVMFAFSDLLGDRSLFVAAQAQGEVKDLGGQVFYTDLGSRWNWGVGASHIPYRFIGGQQLFDPSTGNVIVVLDDQRWFNSQVLGRLQYPFSQVRRVEFGAGYTRWGFDVTRDIFVFNQVGQLIDRSRESLPTADPLHLGEVSTAFVQDNSYFGFVSPVRGWRSRLDVGQTVGSLNFTRVTADHRSYFAAHQNLTLAYRLLHVGRYGISERGGTQNPLRPFNLGWEGLVRGYSPQSFRQTECTWTPEGQCAEFERLLGQRIGIASVEARIPLLGSERFGILNFPYLPTEIAVFTDAGVAWNAGDGANLTFDRETTDRVPVVSTGVSARMNLFGALIMEIYYAVPWQRPERGGHFGFQIMPGW
jgi:hypothetical protein